MRCNSGRPADNLQERDACDPIKDPCEECCTCTEPSDFNCEVCRHFVCNVLDIACGRRHEDTCYLCTCCDAGPPQPPPGPPLRRTASPQPDTRRCRRANSPVARCGTWHLSLLSALPIRSTAHHKRTCLHQPRPCILCGEAAGACRACKTSCTTSGTRTNRPRSNTPLDYLVAHWPTPTMPLNSTAFSLNHYSLR